MVYFTEIDISSDVTCKEPFVLCIHVAKFIKIHFTGQIFIRHLHNIFHEVNEHIL